MILAILQQHLLDDNKCVAEWLISELADPKSQVNANLRSLQMEYLGHRLQAIFNEHPQSSVDAIAQLIQGSLSAQQKQNLIGSLAAQLDEPTSNLEQNSENSQEEETHAPSDQNQEHSPEH